MIRIGNVYYFEEKGMIKLGNISLRLSDFPYYLSKFLNYENWGLNTKKREIQGKQLIAADFAKQHLIEFIRNVCKWGNYAGIGGRILKQNDFGFIRASFIEAWRSLNLREPDVLEALIRINRIKHLGTPSFASKHLRFLNPKVCPVLDKKIWRGVNIYPFSPQGYNQFSGDCRHVASILEEKYIINPTARDSGEWFAADVEMAILSYLWPPESRSARVRCRGTNC